MGAWGEPASAPGPAPPGRPSGGESPGSPGRRPGLPPLLRPWGDAGLTPCASQEPGSKRTPIPAGNCRQGFASPTATTAPALLRLPASVRTRIPVRDSSIAEGGGARRGGMHNGSLREAPETLQDRLCVLERLRRRSPGVTYIPHAIDWGEELHSPSPQTHWSGPSPRAVTVVTASSGRGGGSPLFIVVGQVEAVTAPGVALRTPGLTVAKWASPRSPSSSSSSSPTTKQRAPLPSGCGGNRCRVSHPELFGGTGPKFVGFRGCFQVRRTDGR